MNAPPLPVVSPPKLPVPSTVRPALIEELPDVLPAWLTSFATHLALFLILLLISLGGGNGLGAGGGQGIELDAGGSQGQDGDGIEGEGALATAPEISNEQPIELPAEVQPSEVASSDAFAQSMPESPKLDLTGFALGEFAAGENKEAGNGDGRGDGQGDGVGFGEGFGGSPGLGIIPIQTSVFGLKSEGTRFVYVFDRSESMTSTLTYSIEGVPAYTISPLQAAKAELLRSLKDLGPKHQFQIVFYNHESTVFDRKGNARPQLLQATPQQKQKAARFVEYIEGDGGTYHVEPLEIALSLRPDVIYLLTDGEEKDDPAPYHIDHLKKLNKSHARINVIQFCFEKRSEGTLAQLAKQTGGKHVVIDIARLRPALPNAPPVEEKDPGEVPSAP